MRPLPEEFRKDGFDFRLMRRRGNVAVYEKSKPEHAEPTYEVGKSVATRQDLPLARTLKPQSPGHQARMGHPTYTTFSDAMKRFGSLEGANAGKAKSHKIINSDKR